MGCHNLPKFRGICKVDDCGKVVKVLGLCAMHAKRLRVHGDVNIVLQRGGKNKAPFDVCQIDGCDKPFQARAMCQMHYRRWELYGDPNYVQIKKQGSAKYRYVVEPEHPNAKSDGTIAEHRLVMSQMIGRPLMPGENVHHINGDGKDNRPENLELWNTVQPAGQRPADKVKYALEILTLYAPELLAGDDA